MELKYDIEKGEIYFELIDSKRELIDNNTPSTPVISPNNKFAVYISPLEWEEVGKLYLIDLSNCSKKIIYEPVNDKLVPKAVTWINSNKLALILGYGSGTISVGGNVFTYNLDSKELKQITHFKENIQITNIGMKENILELKGIEYTDNNFMNKEEYFFQIKESL
jgi:hypothetical protein